MSKTVQDIVGGVLALAGVAALILGISPWPCIAAIGIGALLIDPADVQAVASKVLPFLNKGS